MNIDLLMTSVLFGMALCGIIYFALDQIKDVKRRESWKAKYLLIITFPIRFVWSLVVRFYRRHALQFRYFLYGFSTCIICFSYIVEKFLP